MKTHSMKTWSGRNAVSLSRRLIRKRLAGLYIACALVGGIATAQQAPLTGYFGYVAFTEDLSPAAADRLVVLDCNQIVPPNAIPATAIITFTLRQAVTNTSRRRAAQTRREGPR